LAHVLQCPRITLYTQFERTPTPDQLAAYRQLVGRAAAHEPVAYLVGHREFYSLDFIVTPDVLVPRPETELLADKAIEHLKPLGGRGRYWDACTGSGALAAAVGVHAPEAAVLATDTSEAALATARQNMAKHGLAQRVTVARVDLLDLPEELAERGPFDAVTVNPPYVSEAEMAELPPGVLREPRVALCGGDDGLDCIRSILQQAPNILADHGMLAMEIGHGQAGHVWDMVNKIGRYERIEFARDTADVERALVAHKASGPVVR